MSNVWTLESMEEEIEREYAPLSFQANGETFVLQSLLRVGKNVRDAVIERLGQLDSDDEKIDEAQSLAAAKFVLSSVTKDGKGDYLVSILGSDLLKHMKLLSKWTEATQPGEATDSPA